MGNVDSPSDGGEENYRWICSLFNDDSQQENRGDQGDSAEVAEPQEQQHHYQQYPQSLPGAGDEYHLHSQHTEQQQRHNGLSQPTEESAMAATISAAANTMYGAEALAVDCSSYRPLQGAATGGLATGDMLVAATGFGGTGNPSALAAFGPISQVGDDQFTALTTHLTAALDAAGILQPPGSAPALLVPPAAFTHVPHQAPPQP
ncbi:hypothetical protein Agub_g2703, partial [Astrephomene gubernaculifera]